MSEGRSWAIILVSITILAVIAGCISQKESTTNIEKATKNVDHAIMKKPNWQISVNASGNWIAQILNDSAATVGPWDRTVRDNHSGKDNEIFYYNNTSNIDIQVTLDQEDKYVMVQLKQAHKNDSIIYSDSGIGHLWIRNDESYIHTGKPIILAVTDTGSDDEILAYYSFKSELESRGYQILIPGSNSNADTLLVDKGKSISGKEYYSEDERARGFKHTYKGFIIKYRLQLINSSGSTIFDKTILGETPEKVNCRTSGYSYCLQEEAEKQLKPKLRSFLDSKLPITVILIDGIPIKITYNQSGKLDN